MGAIPTPSNNFNGQGRRAEEYLNPGAAANYVAPTAANNTDNPQETNGETDITPPASQPTNNANPYGSLNYNNGVLSYDGTGGDNKKFDTSGKAGYYGTGAGLQGNANYTASNAILQQQQANQANNAEAMARLAAGNNAQTAAAVNQSGLAGQGAGIAMQGNTAQQNAQQAAQFMLDSNAQQAQAQEQAARLAMQEKQFAQENIDKVKADWNAAVERGDYDLADKISRENDLGFSTSNNRFTDRLNFIDGRQKDLAAAAANSQDPQEMQQLQAQANYYSWLKKQMEDAKENGTDFFRVNAQTITDPKNYSDPIREWTTEEKNSWRTITGILSNLDGEISPQASIIANDVNTKVLTAGGFANIDDFWRRASTEQIKQYGEMLGYVMNMFDAQGAVNPLSMSKLDTFLGRDSAAFNTERGSRQAEVDQNTITNPDAPFSEKVKVIKSLDENVRLNPDGTINTTGGGVPKAQWIDNTLGDLYALYEDVLSAAKSNKGNLSTETANFKAAVNKFNAAAQKYGLGTNGFGGGDVRRAESKRKSQAGQILDDVKDFSKMFGIDFDNWLNGRGVV